MFDRVLYYFRQLCAIPHGSGNTAAVSDFCVSLANDFGLKSVKDEVGNVVIYIPASYGFENVPPVILQGHLDMVCAKDSGCAKDMEKDGLNVIESDLFIEADGTSLGGDDGIAIAFCLAIAENREGFIHPALELVFTIDEEVGMDGAKALDPSLLRSRILINIDNEEEGIAIVSCAGGARIDARRNFQYEGTAPCVSVKLSGLLGGHSGTEITKGHVNAIRFLAGILSGNGVRLSSFKGGNADNAIPSQCEAVFSAGESAIERIKHELQLFLDSGKEPEAKSEIAFEDECPIIGDAESETLLKTIIGVPDGVITYGVIPGTAQTSSNLGIASFEKGELHLSHAFRSSDEAEKREYTAKILSFYSENGFEAEMHSEYPAWEYREKSVLREVFSEEFRKLFGKEMKFEAIHAGLECGIFSGKIEGLDCISIGPNIFDIHSPKERLDKQSAGRTFELLISVLKNLGGRCES